MAARRRARPHGQIRRSQLVGQFGPGSLIDMPRHSVIVGGLEQWGDPEKNGFPPVFEDRLKANLEQALELQGLRFFSPPIDLDTFGDEAPQGITVWEFPQWFVAQWAPTDTPGKRPLVHERRLVSGRFLADDKKPKPVVPIRFVQACRNGHVSDIDWPTFAHRGNSNCQQQLWLLEKGTSGDFLDLFIQCDCGVPMRSVFEATRFGEDGMSPLGLCKGQRPWLGPNSRDPDPCLSDGGKHSPNKLLVRTASNAYFARVVSAISIPEKDRKVRQAVEHLWTDFMVQCESQADVKHERKKPKVQAALGTLTDKQVFAEIQRRKAPTPTPAKKLKQAEIETLLSVEDELGDDKLGSDFYATVLPAKKPQSRILEAFHKIVLVQRMREVRVQVGFTRFEDQAPTIDGELDLNVGMASLSREATWLPAVENYGEGLFLSFDPKRLTDWSKRPAVQTREKELHDGFKAWVDSQRGSKEKKQSIVAPPVVYVMLHSLSHLLINAMSLECGYSASSIRERIYVTNEGAGILLHTGTPDAEGTLGGLVEVGKRFDEILRVALELGKLCSNDPVCAAHRPNDSNEERPLHGAACHGCLLTSESSCERRNELLDRALVVATVEDGGCEFFTEAE